YTLILWPWKDRRIRVGTPAFPAGRRYARRTPRMRKTLLTLAFLAVATVTSAGEEEIRVPRGAQALPDSYIVVLADAAFGAATVSRPAVSQIADDLARRPGGRGTDVYAHALRGVTTPRNRARAR